MVLRKLSQSFKVCVALMLSVLSSGILQVAPVYATTGTLLPVWCQETGNKWSAQQGTGDNDHRYPLMGQFSTEYGVVTSSNSSEYPTATVGQTLWANSGGMPKTLDDACVAQYTSVTADAATVKLDPCGTVNDMYTIPSKARVTYKVNGVVKAAGDYSTGGALSITVTAEAESGFVLSGTTTWTLNFTDVPCTTQVTPQEPTVNAVCGPNNDTVTLPTQTGVTYSTPVWANNSVTITATAQPGYTLTGQTSWTFTDMNTACNDNNKVTFCHRTRSATNPYVTLTVDKNAVDGVAGNSGNEADHYGEHKGPIFNASTMKSGDTWGDIIPPVSPHSGYNYSAEGKSILENGCKVGGTTPNVCVASTRNYASAWGAYPEVGGGGSYEIRPSGLFIYTPEVASYVSGGFSAGNISLADIDQMSYKTMRLLTSTGPNNQVVTAYYLYVDLDGDLSTNDKSYLVFEPLYNGTVTPGTWQTWDVINGGNAVFWTSYSDGNPTERWSDILADYPDAIALEYGFNQGTYNQGTDAAIQDLSFDCAVNTFSNGRVNSDTDEKPVTSVTPGGGQGGGRVLSAATQAVLPAMLPATGAKDSPFMIIAAALLAYGAAYFLQGRRNILRNQA